MKYSSRECPFTKEELAEMYWSNCMSIPKMAQAAKDKQGCEIAPSHQLVAKWMRKEGLETDTSGKRNSIFRTKHGKTGTRKFSSWSCAKSRTTNKSNTHYKDYGGRGITMYKPWLDSFTQFDIDVPDPPDETYTLERIDNEKGYFPGNVKWATHLEQQSNTRRSVLLTYDGKTLTMTQWANLTGVPKQTIGARLRRGKKTVAQALGFENSSRSDKGTTRTARIG